jgi:hypothetical protein
MKASNKIRLYVVSKVNQQKIYLDGVHANTRQELAMYLGINSILFQPNKEYTYTISDVVAEKSHNFVKAGVISGAIVGILIPPLVFGSFIGAVLGFFIGSYNEELADCYVDFFNKS